MSTDEAQSIMDYINKPQKTKSGKYITKWEKVRTILDLKKGDKKIYESTSDFLVKKWLTLHRFFLDAFMQLSVLEPADKSVPVPSVTLETKLTVAQKFKKAYDLIVARGDTPTYARLKTESGIKSDPTIKKYKKIFGV